MDNATRKIVAEMNRASDEERIVFPELVGTLIAAGVERYHVDLARHERTFYMPDGTSELVSTHQSPPAAQAFSAKDVDAAVRATQRGDIQYREFCVRIAEAGCVGYHVSLVGRRAVYYGRTGDVHVEHFPAARP